MLWSLSLCSVRDEKHVLHHPVEEREGERGKERREERRGEKERRERLRETSDECFESLRRHTEVILQTSFLLRPLLLISTAESSIHQKNHISPCENSATSCISTIGYMLCNGHVSVYVLTVQYNMHHWQSKPTDC